MYQSGSFAEGGTQFEVQLEKILFSLLSSSTFEYRKPSYVNFCASNVIVLLCSSADKEESRCGRQGRTVGLLQDRKILSVIGRKRKNKLFCATSAYSRGAKLHFWQQFCLFLPVQHIMEANLDHQYIFLPYGII